MNSGSGFVNPGSLTLSLTVQMDSGDTIAHLNGVLTKIMNQKGQGGEFRVEVEELEEIKITIIIIMHLLGVAPAGYLTASDSGP
jgi:hypothetical protein